MQAAYDGYYTVSLDEVLPVCDLSATGTGAPMVTAEQHFPLLKDAAFLLNIGHRADEIDTDALRASPHEEVLPFIEAFDLGGSTIYLLADGSMFNLTAGWGVSLNAFDITLAVMTAGIKYLVIEGACPPRRAPAHQHSLGTVFIVSLYP